MFTRLELEAIAWVVAAIAACIGLYFYDAHEQALGAASITSAVQATTTKIAADDAAQAASAAAEQASALHEATVQNAARMVDARAAESVVQRMRDDSVRRAAATTAAAAAAGSNTGVSTRSDLVWRRLLDAAYQEADDSASDAADLAVTVRGLRTSGQLCKRDYAAASAVKP